MDKTSPMKSKPLVDVTCKLGTKGCFEDGRCHALGNCENKIVTNADRIRAMSDEELADWISRTQVSNVAEAFEVIGYVWKQPDNLKDGVKKECLEWLKQPAEK